MHPFEKIAVPRTLSSILGLFVVLLLASPGLVLSETRAVSATIDVSKTGAPISKNIYGQFLEHGGDIVNNGVWSEMLVDRKFFYPVATTAPTPPPVIGGAGVQVGIGIWLMAAADGPWSRLAGLTGAGWSLVVWVFGESFGGVFAPGLTWLSGAPGAVSFYCAAGVLIALPTRYWRTPKLGRAVLATIGVFFAGMAVLQAWPGRGFWRGVSHGRPGALAEMTSSMAQTPQPGFLAATVRAFISFDEAHGFAVNLFVVVALAGLGVILLAARPVQATRPGLLRAAMVFLAVLCLADWVLVQDIGFFGGSAPPEQHDSPVAAGHRRVPSTGTRPGNGACADRGARTGRGARPGRGARAGRGGGVGRDRAPAQAEAPRRPREPSRPPLPSAGAGVTGSGRPRCAGRSAPRARVRWSRRGPSG